METWGFCRRVVLAGIQLGTQIPIAGATERHAVTFALHDDPGGHRLHASGGQVASNLLPQHGADLVAVEPVQDAAGLLRIDEVVVEVTGVLRGREDGLLGDLVEDHAPDGHLGFEGLQQVPGDGLTLAVTVRREIELVNVLQQALELGDGALLIRADDVEGLEIRIDVHPEASPGFGLVLGRNVGSGTGQVPDVATRRFDDVSVAEVASDLAGLRR
ncbi:Uncharacterised protein [Mycobacteroides abscessus subsp. abscessus]|nr:Uncharacterised protein [Mycobacteroides abscessus subsp. abscessus]